MSVGILKQLFGTRHQRSLRELERTVQGVNAWESKLKLLSLQNLSEKTSCFRQRLDQGESLDQLLPEAFSLVREATRRTLQMRHFDVQLMGGMVLHQGKIAEMCTGEGKTLAAVLACYLNALSGQSVHVVTVNDYLARRDADLVRPIFELLNMTVGVVIDNMGTSQRRQAYRSDVLYGTNNQLGFDYLRDHMAFNTDDCVQRGLNFVVVDEIDSILIDEARTPLIISGTLEDASELYERMNILVQQLIYKGARVDDSPTSPWDKFDRKNKDKSGKNNVEEEEGDFTLDEKNRQVYLTEAGHEKVEHLFHQMGLLKSQQGSIYDLSNISLMHHLNAALRAHYLYHRDVDYIVRDGEVVIVDQHTGRTMQGRRWSDGLHQATEAKERVSICNENQTLASITLQNYFRLYKKLSGMTGTADTEAFEFRQIYALDVVVIPTNKPMIRQDAPDRIYLNMAGKYRAIVREIEQKHQKGQPILVGTASIESSEMLSKLLQECHIPHHVLNAKYHEKEASIIRQAGRPGAVTIATHMAGRGTNIVLGGHLESELAELKTSSPKQIHDTEKAWQKRHDQVLAVGGLHVLGTERHESRRIDNQLRGRSGRQGDPGSSQFFLSLDDPLMRIFASDRIIGLMKKLGMEEDEPIIHNMLTRAIENAQRKVEGHNFDLRKQLLKFDDITNEQRKIIYQQRKELLHVDNIATVIVDMREHMVDRLVEEYSERAHDGLTYDVENLKLYVQKTFNLPQWNFMITSRHVEGVYRESVSQLNRVIADQLAQQEQTLGSETMRHLEKMIVLQSLDTYWKEHLAAMDHLYQGIHLRGYAQKDPVQEYQRESFSMFTEMLQRIRIDVISLLAQVEVRTQQSLHDMQMQQRTMMQHYEATHPLLAGKAQDDRLSRRVGRNERCPCGSRKKYKHCHGRLE